jgi:hypothetical protein
MGVSPVAMNEPGIDTTGKLFPFVQTLKEGKTSGF